MGFCPLALSINTSQSIFQNTSWQKARRERKAAKKQMLLLHLQGNPTLDQGSVIYTTGMLMTTSTAGPGPALWWGPSWTFKGCRVGFPWKLGVAMAQSKTSQRTELISRNQDRSFCSCSLVTVYNTTMNPASFLPTPWKTAVEKPRGN